MSSDKDTRVPPRPPATSVDLIARYNGPLLEEMSPAQRSIYDSIIQSRKRTGISGPFGPWLAVPAIAEPSQALGKVCRYGTTLSFRESELIILLTGAKQRSHTEFDLHKGEAILAGWTLDVISAIPRDDDFSLHNVNENLIPLLAKNKDRAQSDRDVAIALFTTELLQTCTVTDQTYAATKAVLDGKDSVLVEITSIVGYYTYVAFTLNVFNIPSLPPS